MNLKKYSSYIFALLLCAACTAGGYIIKEEEAYYTYNQYKSRLSAVSESLLEGKMTLMLDSRKLSDFTNKLKNRISEWLKTGTIKKPDKIWENFYKKIIQPNTIKKLKETDDTSLLEAYYDKLNNLFKDPTAANAEALIAASKDLKKDTKLIDAFKTYIKATAAKPEKILCNEPVLEYCEFLYFILEKNTPTGDLRLSQTHLKKWNEDARPTGQELWRSIIEKHSKQLEDVKWYKYPANRNAIKESLRLMDEWAASKKSLNRFDDKLDPDHCLSYKDLLCTIPYGIDLINKTLSEAALEENGDIKLLKRYLSLFPSRLCTQLDKNI